jgi:hypothetical protein
MKFFRKAVLSVVGTAGLLAGTESFGQDHSDFAIDLGSGYELVRANAHEVFISNRQNQVVVPGKVIEYAVAGGFVIGQVKMPDWPDEEAKKMFADVVEGYFLIDMTAQTQSLGMTLTCLRETLLKKGIKNMPSMREPTRSAK